MGKLVKQRAGKAVFRVEENRVEDWIVEPAEGRVSTDTHYGDVHAFGSEHIGVLARITFLEISAVGYATDHQEAPGLRLQ